MLFLTGVRGQIATLKFEVDEGTAYLDDVFFKSEHLLLGNPNLIGKPARASEQNFADNYLVERPQYTISYSNPFKGPNWVAYKLDESSLGNLSRPDEPWQKDNLLPFSTLTEGFDYLNTGYDRGHMVTQSHYDRIQKDQLSTYFTSSMLPQHPNNNSLIDLEDGKSYFPAWTNFEKYLRDIVKNEGDSLQRKFEYYIYSGGINYSSNLVDTRTGEEKPKEIKIPEFTWKVAVSTKPGSI